MAVAAVRLDALRAAVTVLPLDGPWEQLRAAAPSAECTPDWVLVFPSVQTVLAEGAFALAVFVTASVAGGVSGIRGMEDTGTQAITIRIGGGTRLPRTTMTRSGTLR